MQILSYILSSLGLFSMIGASLIKGEKMKQILLLVFCGNFLVATSYLLNGSGINGAASCYLGSVQSIINYFYDSKNKPLPKWLIAVYGLSFIAVNLWVSGSITPLCILAIIAALTFIMGILQNSGAKFRFWNMTNLVLWCCYDFFSKAYAGLLTHVPLLVFNSVSMLIHDRKIKEV